MRHAIHQRRDWLTPLLIVCVGLCLALLGALAAVVNPAIPIVLTITVAGAWLLIERPRWGFFVTVVFFYLNVHAVAASAHDVPGPVAALIPLVFLGPLFIRFLIRRDQPLGSYTVVSHTTGIWLIVFLVVIAFSSLRASDTQVAFGWAVDYLIFGLALYYVMLNAIRSEGTLRLVVWALLVACAILGAVTVLQEVTKSYDSTYFGFMPVVGSFLDGTSEAWRGRPGGPVAEPNRYAQILLVVFPLGLGLLRLERGWLRLLAGGLTALTAAGVLLTYSRGAGVALVLILPLAAWLWHIRLRTVLLVGVALLIVTVVALPSFVARMSTLANLTSVASSDDPRAADRSVQSRFTKNLAAWNMYLDYPVIGVGPRNYGVHSERYADPLSSRVDTELNYPHTLYLGLAAELGSLGLLVFIGAVLATMKDLWRVRQRCWVTIPHMADYANAMLLSLFAYGLTAVFLHLSYQRYFWFILAIGGAVVLVARQREAELPAIERAGLSAAKAATPRPAIAPPRQAPLPAD
jgi:O-antigen ligase